MATSIPVGNPTDTDPPQGLSEIPLGPSDSSDSASDSQGDGTLDHDRAQTARGDGLMEPADDAELPADETDPIGKREAKGIAETPAAFDDA